MTSAKPATPLPGRPQQVDVAIIGAGFSGLGMAIRLKQAGMHDFLLLEKEDQVGGTWLLNQYPGCACDVQSHLYSFSFAPNPDWRRMFASQPEILAYLKNCARRFGLGPHLRLGTEIRHAAWDAGAGVWRIELSGGAEISARILITAVGGLSRPAIPELPGLSDFAGAAFHSQQWDHDVDLRDKRVAVIGTGASAVQFVPQIVDQVQQLDLYQRSAAWILPKPDREIGLAERLLYRGSARALAAQRARLYVTLEARAMAMVKNPRLMKVAEREARAYLRHKVSDRGLRRRLTPDYAMGCKRVLMSRDYYPALARDNAEVICGQVQGISKHGVIGGDGQQRPADVIIFGTGFQVRNPLGPVDLIGDRGQSLREVWDGRPQAYLGTTVSGFPNLFTMLGPNTGLGHNSIIYMIESQITYVLDALRKMRRRRVHAVNVREPVMREYNAEIQRRTLGTIWASGCKSWYLDADGHNFSLWPSYTWQFRRQTRRFKLSDYRLSPEPAVQSRLARTDKAPEPA